MSDEVLLSVESGVAVLTLNRPDARNAVNRAVSDQMAAAMDQLDARPDLACGVITGFGAVKNTARMPSGAHAVVIGDEVTPRLRLFYGDPDAPALEMPHPALINMLVDGWG